MQLNPLRLATWTSAFFIASVLFSNTVALRLILLAAGGALALLAVIYDREPIRPLPPIWLAFAFWAAWATLSLAWSVEPERTLKELRNEILYAGLALWMCYVAAQARESRRVVLPIVGAAVVLLCALALYSFPQGLVRNGERWHGGSGNLSMIVLTVLPCILMAGWYGHRHRLAVLRNCSIALFILVLGAAYTTLNRTVWFGIAVELVLIAALVALREGMPSSPRTRAFGALVVILAIGGAGLMSAMTRAEREKDIGSALVVVDDARLALWPVVMEHIKERPLLGYGFGPGQLRQPLHAQFNNRLLWHAHNLFLETVVQLGITGLVLLLILLGATVREAWTLARSSDALARACGIALLGLVAGMLIRNMTDVLLVRHNALLYWAVVGALLAWGCRGNADDQLRPADRARKAK